jgi:hypothetical protein
MFRINVGPRDIVAKMVLPLPASIRAGLTVLAARLTRLYCVLLVALGMLGTAPGAGLPGQVAQGAAGVVAMSLVTGAALVAVSESAVADGQTDPFTSMCNQASSAQTGLQKLLGYLAWFGLIGCVGYAFFSRGKFPYGWAACILGGLFLVSYWPLIYGWMFSGSNGTSTMASCGS